MAITQKLREIGGIINSTDLNYNFNRMAEDLQLAVEGVIFDKDYSQVETMADRNAIPEDRLTQGLWCAVAENGIVYEYNKRNDLITASSQVRYFGPDNNDLPNIPYIKDGDPSSGILLNAKYICKAGKDANWQYNSGTSGEIYQDQDWALYIKKDTEAVGKWIRVAKWIPIMNVNSILENNLVGKLENLHTEDKNNVVNAINEIHDDLGTIQDLTTTDKSSAVAGINELDGRIGNLNSLTTDHKENLVSSINELDTNVGPVETLTTVAKTATGAINELDSEMGDLSGLHTEAKNTITDAINEVHDDLGTLSDLTTTAKNTAVAAINEVDSNIGELNNLTTTAKNDTVSAINEVDKDVGDITKLTTAKKDDTVSAINELKSITDTLRGATILIGKIELDTKDVTPEALTARALEIMGGTTVQAGWELVDREQHEWIWNGNNWQDLEQPNIYPAQNGILGTVRGAETGDVSITDGNLTVNHSKDSDKLNRQEASYYSTKAYADTKADKTNVLQLDNTTEYTPTADYHPTTKKYVDTIAGGASWGMIVNNIEDQEDLMELFNERPTKEEVLTKTNTTAYAPSSNYHPATKKYVDDKYADRNKWGQITGDIADQQDLQNELITKQDKATAWNTTNLVASTEQPEIPASGYIIWIDLNS